MIGQRLLSMVCITPGTPLRPGGSDRYTLDNALDFERKTIPNFDERVRGKRIFDYGFGSGHQAIAMVRQCGALKVDGIDVVPRYISAARRMVADLGETRVCLWHYDEYSFAEHRESYDVIASLGCFEHYNDPAGELRKMINLVKPDGTILITFAEPWYSHNGGHSYEWCKLPWAHLIFPERTFMRIHNLYYPNCTQLTFSPGLNRMSVERFERTIRNSTCKVEFLRRYATRSLSVVTRLPILQEILTSSCACILHKPLSLAAR